MTGNLDTLDSEVPQTCWWQSAIRFTPERTTSRCPGAAAPKLARMLSTLQIAGTLLAVPVGLGSAYSMYRANFSAEATCQSLRANIVAMLDRSVDANARHMLVRRDVETFERSCGAVDPDATAAFKTLLAADKKSPPPWRRRS